MRVAPFLLAAFLACVCACTNKPDVQAARSISGEIEKALNSKDAEKLKANLADDAVLLLANQTVLAGADAIASRYAGAFKQINYNLSLSSTGIEPAGDLVLDRGSFAGDIKSADGRTTAPVSGKYMHVLKLQAGRWQIWRAAWEFDKPTEQTSCEKTGTRSCCCKDIGGNDCIARPDNGCTSEFPTSILLP
jgi:ketosteroid isomerase-like protein